jgi:hypothetical protein
MKHKLLFPFKSSPIFLLFFLFANLQVSAADYYLDPAGNDNNNGASPATAWQTLSKINNTTFLPGDRILLKASGTWNGQLWPKGSGSSSSPIIIDQYGTGNKPVINGQGTNYPSTLITGTVMLYNQSYWEINNLEVTNYSETLVNARAGIIALSVSATIQNHIHIKNCEVHDVNANPSPNLSNSNNKNSGGIIIFGSSIDKDGNYVNVNSGFNNVLVEGCKVYNVTKEGIRNKSDNNGAFPRVNSNIIFRNNHVENVFGDGIVLGEIFAGGVVEHNFVKNVAYTNSANYAGIWTHYSTGSIIQFNEVCDMIGGSNDGEAFDADNNCDGDIFQYNYSHNNVGGFFLMMPSAKNITIRYNISQNDGNGKELFHYTSNSNATNYIYNNTFYLGAGITTTLFKDGNTSRTVKFYNNIIKVEGTITKFADNEFSPSSYFANNCFYPANITNINGPKSHPGLISQDPKLTDPSLVTYGLNNVNGFKLLSSSPLINAGINISNNGNRDYLNTPLYVSNKADIGAIEYPDVAPLPPAPSLGGLVPIADTYVRNGSYANTNFGTLGTLSVKKDATSYERETFLKFDLSSLNEVPTIGKLRLYIDSGDDDVATNAWKIYYLNDDSWTETGLTWNNKPTMGTELTSAAGAVVGSTVEFDILAQLQAEYHGDKILSLKIVSTTSGSKTNVEFASKENPIPYLVPLLVTQAVPAVIKNQHVIFWQDFNQSNALKDYILSSNNSAGGTNGGAIIDNNSARFDSFGQFYGSLPANTTYAIDGDGLKITKSTGSVAQATAQIKGLSYGTDLIFAQFDINTSISSTLPSGTPIFFYFGNGYTTNSNADQNSALYQSLAVFFPSAGNVTPNATFYIKINGTNSPNFQGKQKITWIINRSTNTINYIGLDDAVHSLTANGDYDVWVGNVKINIDAAVPANAGASTLGDFRIRTAGTWTGFLAVDNLAIGYLPTDGSGGVLPIELTYFKAKANANSVNLSWSTANEVNASHFSVNRSADGQNFAKIGEVKALGKASSYHFTDFSPIKGTNYYQLIPTDYDGTKTLSATISAKILATTLDFNIEKISNEQVVLNIFAPKQLAAHISIHNILGQKLVSKPVLLSEGNNSITISAKLSGLAIATIDTTEGKLSKKFLRL